MECFRLQELKKTQFKVAETIGKPVISQNSRLEGGLGAGG